MRCLHCKKPFEPKRRHKTPPKFCSDQHRAAYHNSRQKLLSAKEYKRLLKIEKLFDKANSPQFRRYLKHESRINAWLKANKK